MNNSNYKNIKFQCKNVKNYCAHEKDFHSDCILFEKTKLDKLYDASPDASPVYMNIDPLDVLRPYGEGYKRTVDILKMSPLSQARSVQEEVSGGIRKEHKLSVLKKELVSVKKNLNDDLEQCLDSVNHQEDKLFIEKTDLRVRKLRKRLKRRERKIANLKEELRLQKDNSMNVQISSYSGGFSNSSHLSQKRAHDYNESLEKVKKFLTTEGALDRLREANENNANKNDIKSKEFKANVTTFNVITNVLEQAHMFDQKANPRSVAEFRKQQEKNPAKTVLEIINLIVSLIKFCFYSIPQVQWVLSGLVLAGLKDDFSPGRLLFLSIVSNISIRSLCLIGCLQRVKDFSEKIFGSKYMVYKTCTSLKILGVQKYFGMKRGGTLNEDGENDTAIYHCAYSLFMDNIVKYYENHVKGFELGVSEIRGLWAADGTPFKNGVCLFSYGLKIYSVCKPEEIPEELKIFLAGCSYGLGDTHKNFDIIMKPFMKKIAKTIRRGFIYVTRNEVRVKQFINLSFSADLKCLQQVLGFGSNNNDFFTMSKMSSRSDLYCPSCFCDQKCKAEGIKYCAHHPMYIHTPVENPFNCEYFNSDITDEIIYDEEEENYVSRITSLEDAQNVLRKIVKACSSSATMQESILLSEDRVASLSKVKTVEAVKMWCKDNLITLSYKKLDLKGEIYDPTCIDFIKEEGGDDLFEANLLLYVNQKEIDNYVSSQKVGCSRRSSNFPHLKSMLKAILIWQLKDWKFRQYELKSRSDRDKLLSHLDLIPCFLHFRMRSSRVLLNLFFKFCETNSQSNQTFDDIQNVVLASIGHVKQAKNFNIKLETGKKAAWHLDGNDMKSAMSDHSKLLDVFFSTTALKENVDKYGVLCYSNWLKLFSLYEKINESLCRRDYYFKDEDIKILKDQISELHVLFVTMHEPKSVSIYFHILFNGVFLNILRKHRNIAVFDQQSFELLQKTQKEAARRCTNLKSIAKSMFLYYVNIFVLNVETNCEQWPDNGEFLAEMDQIHNLSAEERKDIFSSVLQEDGEEEEINSDYMHEDVVPCECEGHLEDWQIDDGIPIDDEEERNESEY